MAEGQITVDSADLEKFLEKTLQKYVNGKLDKANENITRLAEHLIRQDRVVARNQKALTKHIEELKPYLEGLDFLKKLYKYGKWGGPVILSIIAFFVAIKTFFFGI